MSQFGSSLQFSTPSVITISANPGIFTSGNMALINNSMPASVLTPDNQINHGGFVGGKIIQTFSDPASVGSVGGLAAIAAKNTEALKIGTNGVTPSSTGTGTAVSTGLNVSAGGDFLIILIVIFGFIYFILK